MKVSDVKLGASILHVLGDIWESAIGCITSIGHFIVCLFSLITSISILITYPICYPFAKSILLPRTIKRAEKATEEQIYRMFPDKVKTDETNK